jgi:hypothetical protein
MNVQPAALFEAVIEVGDTGLTGTIGVEANDNTGATTVAFTTDGITEIAAGVYAAASLEAPGAEGQYTLIWRDGAAGEPQPNRGRARRNGTRARRRDR